MTILPFPGGDYSNPGQLENLSASERIRWAHNTYGRGLVLSTSFGIQSAVLLHQAVTVDPNIPVIFVDTGYLFDETYRYAEDIAKRLDLNLHVYSAHRSPQFQEAVEGRRWETGEPLQKRAFDIETKVEPVNRALKELGAKAWLSGLRREQSERRSSLTAQETQNGILKIYPIIDWSNRDVFYYMKKHSLPQHPLFEKGYTSVGNWFDSKPGSAREECGIHVQESLKMGGAGLSGPVVA